ncbi:hypothetical protein ACP8ZO_25290, partial [Escherichia coli]
MNAVHIRFDSNSPVMADVQEEGKPQLWNHKQNDALGLYLDLLIQAINTGTINAEDWQEDARLNTSSVALVTSGLERLSNLLSKKDSVFVSDLLREAKVNELDETLSTTRLNHLIDKGYERITLQLDLGGESPGYLEKDKHYREADAALLNVIYPTNLSKINTRRK